MNTGEVKFRPIRKGDLSGRCRVDSPVELFETVALFRKDQIQLCKTGSRITSAVAAGVFLKCYFYRTFFSQLRHIVRRSRAKSCTLSALAIRKAGVSTPAPWGYLREYGLLLPMRDYLFTELLPEGTVYLPQLLSESREEAAEKIVRCLEKLHRNGIEHGDLSLRNIYVDGNGEAGVIDLDGCRIHTAPLDIKRRTRELARVISSAARIDNSCSLEAFEKMFSELYKTLCGIELNSSELHARSAYLFNRRRA